MGCDQCRAPGFFSGEIAKFDVGIYIGEGGIEYDTDQTQIFGPKFDIIARGIYISAGVRKTQVVAMTRAQDYNYVEDNGLNSFVVGHLMNKLPADVEVQGLLDAAVLGAPGAGIRTYSTRGELKQDTLNSAFGAQSPGFVGIYTDSLNRRFVVARFNVSLEPYVDEWYHGGPLTRTPD